MDREEAIKQVKRRIGSTDLTDEEIYAIWLETKNADCAAAEIWAQKAGAGGDLIDMSEGSSNRKLSQVAKQAEERANFFQARCDAKTGACDPTKRPSRVRPIVRP